MNREDIIRLYKAIETEKSKGNIKFKYAILKNKGVIKDEIDALLKVEEDIEKILQPFNEERNNLIKEIGTLDTEKNSYLIKTDDTEKVSEFNKRIKELKEKYKDEINEHNNKLTEYKDLLTKKLDKSFVFEEINIENCPEDLETNSLEVFMKFNIIK